MRFAPTDDEVMVEDTLDRLLTEMIDAAPRRDGEPPAPEPGALRARLGQLGLWGGWLPECAGGGGGGARMLLILARGLGRLGLLHGPRAPRQPLQAGQLLLRGHRLG